MDKYVAPRKTPPRFPAVDKVIKQKGSGMDFIRASGLHLMTYYAMQSGRTTPTLGTIYAVLNYTNMSFEEAFGEAQ